MSNALWMTKHNCHLHFSAQCHTCRSSSTFYDPITLHLVPSVNVDWDYNHITEDVLFKRTNELRTFLIYHNDDKSIDDLLKLTFLEIWRGRITPSEKSKSVQKPKPKHRHQYPIAVIKFWAKWLNGGPSANYNLLLPPSPWSKYCEAKE